MATLENIEFCVQNLSSAVETLQKFRPSVKFLIILVMCKIKVNLYFSQLSILFGITARTMSKYFFGFLPILKSVLETVIFWPTNAQVQANMPNCFNENFSNTKAIMDCSESAIEKLKDLDSRIKTYSHYKGENSHCLSSYNLCNHFNLFRNLHSEI